MGTKLLKNALIGGLIAFIWGMLSWMVFPWHKTTMHAFKNEEKMAQMIIENAPESGVYFMPMQSCNEKMKPGPFMFSAIRLHEEGASCSKHFVFSFVTQAIAAFLIAWLLMHTKGITYWKRVLFVTMVGLTAGILCYLPSWNWLGFSAHYTFIGMLDLIIGWFLAGLALAKFAK